MYIPHHFKAKDIDQVKAFVKENAFAVLVSVHKGKPVATHIPLLLQQKEGKDYLLGHVSKGNPQWKSITDQEEILAIFSGAHTYISSSWYDHENVPTWNYTVVHIYGKARIIEGEELWLSLKHLVDKYEAGREGRVRMEEMSEALLRKELRGIVGFEIEITKIEAAYKLSQNRNDHDYKNIIHRLEEQLDSNAQQVAAAMKKLNREAKD